jgi:hypothetical protein
VHLSRWSCCGLREGLSRGYNFDVRVRVLSESEDVLGVMECLVSVNGKGVRYSVLKEEAREEPRSEVYPMIIIE